MKKILILLWSCLSLISNAQTVTDIDGNVYQTIKIGDQVWMQENLRVTKFNDGTPLIKESITKDCETCHSQNWDTLSPMYTTYPWSDIAKNGLIYNSIVTDNKNVCPIGWHVPSVDEFLTLSKNSGGQYSWKLTIKDTTSLFKVGVHKHHRPTNYYYNEPTTFSRFETTNFWTSTKVIYTIDYQYGITKTISGQYSYSFKFHPDKGIVNEPIKTLRGYGYYIRCIQN